MPTGGLPEGGKTIFEKVYNEAKKAGKSEEYAARVAWTAVKNAGWRKNEKGEWVKGKSEVSEFSMAVIKAVFDKENQVMRWRGVSSDVDPDLYDERMSTELFTDFVERIKNKTPVPEPFNQVICEDSWCGGVPYLSVAHYKAGDGGKNLPGRVDEDGIYVDGSRLKSKGVLYDNPLGMATFKSLCDDLYSKKSDPNHQPVRISIGFLDLQHKHVAESGGQDFTFTRTDIGQICPLCAQGIGNKIYTKGQLVHLAMTRVPVNPRTLMEVDKSMDNGIITKKDDAKSIIGDLVDELDEKSLAEDILVVKADGSMIVPDNDKKVDLDQCYDPNTGGYDQECVDNMLMGNTVGMRNEMESVKSDVAEKAVTKAEGDCSHPSSHYLIVEDSSKPTTWHLRVKDCSGKVDTRLLGAAHAALTKGFRGNKYEGPSKGKALAKLRSLYKSHGLDWPEGDGEKKSMVEESMELGGKTVEEKKFEYEGVHGDPRQDMKKAPMKAKVDEEETPEEDAKETKKEEEAEDKKMKSLDAVYNSFKSKVGETSSVDEINAAFQEFAHGVEKALAPEPKPVDMTNIAEIVKSAVGEAVAPLNMKIAQLEAKLSMPQKSSVTIPAPRSLTLRPADLLQKSDTPAAPRRQLTQIEKIARRSTGLDVD